MDTEGSDVCACLARDPEYSKVALLIKFEECRLIYRSNAKLTLDSRDEGRSLEKGTSESLDGSREGRGVGQI